MITLNQARPHDSNQSVSDKHGAIQYCLGDRVWEDLRVHYGRIAFLEQHLDRLYESAKAVDMEMDVDRAQLSERLYHTLEANQMKDRVHIRLMVIRGIKATPYQDPRVTITPPTIVIIPEYKIPLPETLTKGLKLFTVHVRRGYPDVQDQKNFSLTDAYDAEESFVTGTFAGVAPVGEIDGRMIGSGGRGPMVERIQRLYLKMIENES